MVKKVSKKSKKVSKPSKNEIAAEKAGMSVRDYNKQKSSEKSYKDVVDSILKNTPAQNDPLPDFESTYTNDLMKEDYAQSEALFKPYFEQQISNQLEDLNSWAESENINYNRSLRRARFSLASQGGAIGSERTTQEGEITSDHNRSTQNAVRNAERIVGTDNITKAGYQSAGQKQEGSIVGNMNAAIQEGQLWYKQQRSNRYYGNATNYYNQPSTLSLYGTKL